jgi:hypothetical protein
VVAKVADDRPAGCHSNTGASAHAVRLTATSCASPEGSSFVEACTNHACCTTDSACKFSQPCHLSKSKLRSCISVRHLHHSCTAALVQLHCSACCTPACICCVLTTCPTITSPVFDTCLPRWYVTYTSSAVLQLLGPAAPLHAYAVR